MSCQVYYFKHTETFKIIHLTHGIHSVYKHLHDTYVMQSMSDELKREREFYRARGEVCPKDLPQANEEELQQDDKAVNDTDYHRLDEQVWVLFLIMVLLVLLL